MSGDDLGDILPGEVNNNKFEFIIPLREGSAPIWRRSLKQTYPSIIVGAQRRNSVVQVSIVTVLIPASSDYSPQGAEGNRGVKHVVYWKHTNEAGAQPLKVNITVYDNDILQVIFFSIVCSINSLYSFKFDIYLFCKASLF